MELKYIYFCTTFFEIHAFFKITHTFHEILQAPYYDTYTEIFQSELCIILILYLLKKMFINIRTAYAHMIYLDSLYFPLIETDLRGLITSVDII